MHRAVVDIGNTRIKCALFNTYGEIIQQAAFADTEEVSGWLILHKVSRAMISSVARHTLQAMDGIEMWTLDHDTKTPFINLYETPQTLGVDRIAAMAAASVLYPRQAVLVFDIGTCMTIDLLSPENRYRGGNISPGLDMRLKAMHTMTGKLPYATPDAAGNELGVSTVNALANGALHGMIHEIEGYIAHFRSLYPELVVILCGGDISHFEKQVKFRIFAAPDFVLQGLYHLLLLNEN
jgi:type III pantothenate kinase